jgi:hypothetical protein
LSLETDYRRAAYNRRHGVDLDTMIRRLLIELAVGAVLFGE